MFRWGRGLAGWQLFVAAGVTATIGYAGLPSQGVWRAVGFGVIGAASVAAVLIGVRWYRPEQPSTWYAMAAGLSLWLMSSVVDRCTNAGSWPTVSALLVVGGYPMLCWTVVGLIRGRARAHDRTALLDAGIVATALAMLYWSFLLGATVTDHRLDWIQRGLALAFAVGDIALFMLFSLLVTTPGARTTSYRLLLAALSLNAVTDIVMMTAPFELTHPGGLLDVVLLASNLIAGAAALHPSMRQLTVPLPQPPTFVRPRLALLSAAILLAPALILFQGAAGRPGRDWLAIGLGSVVLFLLVTVRMAGLVGRIERQAGHLTALVRLDPLTGLANRRSLDERMAEAITRSRATGETLFAALIDLDHFKRYNDTHGHQAGDELLTEAAAAWRASLRAEDLLARYGGEEFCLLLCGHTIDAAIRVVERLLTATPFGQTFSAGLVQWDGAETAHQLLARADQLLYASKEGGRARVTYQEQRAHVSV
jgi:diguanylate cyclase (GGDEF)-like protein